MRRCKTLFLAVVATAMLLNAGCSSGSEKKQESAAESSKTAVIEIGKSGPDTLEVTLENDTAYKILSFKTKFTSKEEYSANLLSSKVWKPFDTLKWWADKGNEDNGHRIDIQIELNNDKKSVYEIKNIDPAVLKGTVQVKVEKNTAFLEYKNEKGDVVNTLNNVPAEEEKKEEEPKENESEPVKQADPAPVIQPEPQAPAAEYQPVAPAEPVYPVYTPDYQPTIPNEPVDQPTDQPVDQPVGPQTPAEGEVTNPEPTVPDTPTPTPDPGPTETPPAQDPAAEV